MHPRGAQPAEHLIPVDIRQHQIENDDVVVVKLADFEPILAEIGLVTDKPRLLQHQLDAGGGCGIVLNQQNTHYGTSPRAMSGAYQAAVLSAKIGNRGQPESHPGILTRIPRQFTRFYRKFATYKCTSHATLPLGCSASATRDS